jgi:DNA helicase II / ATP-dependent DNA helicase PcrA
MTLTIVGDEGQTMYRFRGSAPELFNSGLDRFVKFSNRYLPVNYRSTRNIITASNRLIVNNYGGDGWDLSTYHEALARDGAPDGEYPTFTLYETPEEEALAVAAAIQDSIDMGRGPEDHFILTRTRAQTAYAEMALLKLRIPYVNLCGGTFWSQRHIRHIFNYLRLAQDVDNDEAFADVVNIASAEFTTRQREYSPTRYLGAEFIRACGHGAYKGMARLTGTWQFKDGIADLKRLVTDIQRRINAGDTPVQLIDYVMEHCYERFLKSENEDDGAGDNSLLGKLDDIATFRDVADKFATLDEFIKWIENAISIANSTRPTGTCVVIATAHRVKGDERDVVFGLGWVEGETPFGTPCGLLPHTFAMIMPPQRTVLPLGGMSSIMDERCIAYVIMTRARHEVHLSGPRLYRKAIMRPSRFVYEAGILE